MESQEQKRLSENIEYSKDWLTQELIKTDFDDKQNHKVTYITMKKIDLLKLVIKFVKLNERGE